MDRYDPERDPEPEEWLALDEQERIALAEDYHRRQRIRIPNRGLHALVHAIVENQLALAEPVVVETLARLRSEGLDRHDAIHAIGSVLAELLFAMTKDAKAVDAPVQGYHARLKELSASSWENV